MLKKIISKILKLFRLLISLFLTYSLFNYLFSVDFKDVISLLRIIFNGKESVENSSSIKYFKNILSDGWKLTKVNYVWGKINLSYFGKNILSKFIKEPIIISSFKEGSIFILSLLSFSFLTIFVINYLLITLLFYLIII